ncbi:MAG TPA: LpqB family beta-propeller domain-containing protein [Aeromicrobium sp.]|nr:LpqB family beta-propeller domain-containing protein [Aeromicrobium sp.]
MRHLVALVVVALTLAACTGLPTSGPVGRLTDAAPTARADTRYEPAKPRRGASAKQILAGYLDAMLAYPQATTVVEAYMTEDAAEAWNPGPGMAVYSRLRTTVGAPIDDRAEVTLQFDQVMEVDPDGRVTVEPKTVRVPLTLVRSEGQWRVATPLGGYLVSERFADDYVRAFPLWFFDGDGQRLVPELSHGLVSPQLAAEMVQLLVDGPRESSLRTYVPSADRVRVEVRGGVADVQLDGAAPESPDRFRAQLLSTLRGVPGIDGVRIFIDGAPDGGVHPIDAVVGFGPRSVADHVYGLTEDGVVAVSNGLRPIAGPWSNGGRGAAGVAVDSTSIAVVNQPRTAVAFAGRNGGGRQSISGTAFVNPSWDDQHRLWLVDRPAGTRVRVVEPGAVRTVDTPLPAGVESFAISPDGVRYVAAVNGTVLVGMVERDAGGRPTGLAAGRVVSVGLAGERGVGWASQVRVEFVATTRYGPQLHSVGFDGADLSVPSVRDAVPNGGVAAWAGPPHDGADRWALDESGRVWRQTAGGIWSKLTTERLRALSVGR